MDAVPTEPINIKKCLNKKKQLDLQQEEIEKENQASNDEIEQNNSFIEKAKEFLRGFDVEELRAKKQIAADKALELDELTRKVEDEERTLEIYCSRAKTLEGVPCGDQFVTSCKFIKDAYKASTMIDGVKNNIADLGQEKELGRQEIVALDVPTVEDHIANYDKLLEKKSNFQSDNVKIRLDIERNNNQLFSIEAGLVENQKDIDYYYQNQEAIENYKELLRSVELCKESLVTFESDLEICETEMLELYKVHGSVEQNIKNLQEQKDELQQLREDYEAYDLYMKCVHSNGIAYDIIKRKLPTINNEIAKILTNIVTFEVFLEDDGRKLDMYIKHPRFEPRPLELGSGAEKTISAMAIRLALLNVSSLPKGNIFILDEPGSALDEENMEGFVRMMDMVKGHFKTVLLISHLDSLKDCVDTQLVIDKKGGFAYINQ
mgnify:CR=1 FL=1